MHALPDGGGVGFAFVSSAIADDDHEDHDSDDSDSHGDDDHGSTSSGNGGRNSGSDSRDGDDTLNQVRDGVRSDALMPLWMIKARVITQFGRKIVGIDIEQKSKVWIYEFKVVDRKGRLLEISVDAKDGSIIKVKNDK